MFHDPTGLKSKALLVGGSILYAILLVRALSGNEQFDFFVYRAGAKVALEGKCPYDTAQIQHEVAQTFPPKEDTDPASNCGFFLPPQALAIFAPFAMMNEATAKAIWLVLATLFGIGCGTLAWTFGRSPDHKGRGWVIIVLIVLLNPVTPPVLMVGQTGLFVAGCIALGQFCFERRGHGIGCFLWALPFVKPHLALPFLVLAAVLGGWKRALGILSFVATLNLIGGLIPRGTLSGALSLFEEYIQYVSSAHKSVLFNLVALNPQISSWNRVLVAMGGAAIDLTVSMTLAGFLLWSLLIVVRLRMAMPWRDALDRDKLDPAYLLAATAVGALFFAQVLGYELILLVLMAPLFLQHYDAGRRGDLWALVGILIFLLIPMKSMDQLANGLQLGEESRGRTLLRSHKCFALAALALYLLIRGGRNGAGGINSSRHDDCASIN